jgi:DNA-binding NarL/FixJ family response regulator
MTGAVQILVVDDHPAVQLGVLRLLDDQRDFEAVAFATGAEAVEAAADKRFDVAVVDYQLGAGEDGLTVTRDLRCLPAPPRVLVYSAYADAPLTALARVAGADGVLSKLTLGDDLCHAIRDIADGQWRWPMLPESVTFSLACRLAPPDRRLFAMWTAGRADADVADVSGLSAPALEHRRRAILKALGGPPGHPRRAGDDGAWPLSYARSRRLRGRHR